MPVMTCGSKLAHLLETYGVSHVFGIPGVHNVELYRGLWQTGIRHVSPRHEQGAGFMADGYARASGRPGVAIVITGPGLTNIATAMGQAYGDSVPLLLISSVNRRHELGLGKGYLHELQNQRNLSAGVTAFTHTLQRASELEDVLAAAFAVFNSSRPRPVNIEIPIDIGESKDEFDPAAARAVRTTAPGPDPAAIAEAAALLKAQKRVAILAGGGAVKAADQVARLAGRLKAPVVTTTNARGLLPVDHPLNALFGIAYDEGRAVLDEAGAVLAIGTEFGETDYDYYSSGPLRPKAPLVRIDIDPRMIALGPRAAVGLVADSGLAVEASIGRSGPSRRASATRAGR
ncbi:MAG: thiamine pyrophosphate-binding protein [Hyphomicrobiaceae bacterium]